MQFILLLAGSLLALLQIDETLSLAQLQSSRSDQTMRRTLITLLTCALVQSSSALVLTGLRAPTVRARLGVHQLQARLSEEDGGAVCVIPEDDDVQL